jgi:hypothetical protein
VKVFRAFSDGGEAKNDELGTCYVHCSMTSIRIPIQCVANNIGSGGEQVSRFIPDGSVDFGNHVVGAQNMAMNVRSSGVDV